MELSNKLYNDILEIYSPNLNSIQLVKLKQACQKSIEENPDLGYNELLSACKVYLKFIIDFPDLSL